MNEGLTSRRVALAATGDARAHSTRRRLADALRELLAEDAGEPSVVAIASRAGVGRSTFYTHFATVDDLVVFVVDEILEALSPIDVRRRSTQELSRDEITRLGLDELIENLTAERDVLLYATRTSEPVVRDRLVAELAHSLEGTIHTEAPGLTGPRLRLSTEFVAAGLMHVALGWIAEPGSASREDVIESLFGILPQWLTSDRGRTVR